MGKFCVWVESYECANGDMLYNTCKKKDVFRGRDFVYCGYCGKKIKIKKARHEKFGKH